MTADTKRTISLAEASQHRSEKDCWLIIHGKVYDVTAFLDEHPGGYDIVVAASGKDGTEDFEEIGHSSTAKEMLADYYIGEYEGGDARPVADSTTTSVPDRKSSSGVGGAIKALLLPLIVILIAYVVYIFEHVNQ
jgi:cytochrome b involved in lipid metabolism